jgi:hypothetical protein
MRPLYILILSIIAIVVIYYIVSAFVLQQQSINKQSVYVHLQPEWNSYPGNIVYDITNVWSQTENSHLDYKERLEMSKSTNVDELRYIHGKSYILVQHDTPPNRVLDWLTVKSRSQHHIVCINSKQTGHNRTRIANKVGIFSVYPNLYGKRYHLF